MRFEDLQAQREAIYVIAAKYGVDNIRVFGSVARGDADDNSDIDLMINTRDDTSLFALSAFQAEMENLLSARVDVVEIETIRNPLRKRYMLAHVRSL
jgi:uncharacterized protein